MAQFLSTRCSRPTIIGQLPLDWPASASQPGNFSEARGGHIVRSHSHIATEPQREAASGRGYVAMWLCGYYFHVRETPPPLNIPKRSSSSGPQPAFWTLGSL